MAAIDPERINRRIDYMQRIAAYPIPAASFAPSRRRCLGEAMREVSLPGDARSIRDRQKQTASGQKQAGISASSNGVVWCKVNQMV